MQTFLIIVGIGSLAGIAAKMILMIIRWNDRMIGRLSKNWKPDDRP